MHITVQFVGLYGLYYVGEYMEMSFRGPIGGHFQTGSSLFFTFLLPSLAIYVSHVIFHTKHCIDGIKSIMSFTQQLALQQNILIRLSFPLLSSSLSFSS